MSRVTVNASISIDGFGAGPHQSLENPQGVGGLALAEWVFATRSFQRMHGKDWTVQGIHDGDRGTTGIDDDFFARSFLNVGAWIFGRNMFGPVRGPWRDNSWKGAWGDTPPWRAPVFVLTHYPRESVPMREERRSISRRMESTGLSREPQQPRMGKTFVSGAASPPFSSIFAPDSLMS